MKVLQFTCLSLGLALCQPAAAALNFYVTLEANGLVIEGEPVVQIMGKDEVNTKIEGQSFDLQITNDDGRVTHGNIRIIKRVNKSSPLLHKALDESANILAEIWFYRRNPDTSLIERDQTWTLTGGRITSISPWSTTGVGGGEGSEPFLEVITINYVTLQIESNTGGTSHTYVVK